MVIVSYASNPRSSSSGLSLSAHRIGALDTASGNWQCIQSFFRDRFATDLAEAIGSPIEALQSRIDLPQFLLCCGKKTVTHIGVFPLVGRICLTAGGLQLLVTLNMIDSLLYFLSLMLQLGSSIIRS